MVDGACKATLRAILNASNDERESNTLMEPYALYKNRSCRILAELSLRRKEFDEAAKYIEMFDKVYPYQHFCGNEWQAYDYYHDWMLARVCEGKGDFRKAIHTLLPDVPDSGLASNNFIVEYLNGLLLREYSFAESRRRELPQLKRQRRKGRVIMKLRKSFSSIRKCRSEHTVDQLWDRILLFRDIFSAEGVLTRNMNEGHDSIVRQQVFF